jgi:hypothetical protein
MPVMDLWIAGHAIVGSADEPTFLVGVLVPEDHMNGAHKNEVHTGVATEITSATGTPALSLRLLTGIEEVTEGNRGSRVLPMASRRTGAAWMVEVVLPMQKRVPRKRPASGPLRAAFRYPSHESSRRFRATRYF